MLVSGRVVPQKMVAKGDDSFAFGALHAYVYVQELWLLVLVTVYIICCYCNRIDIDTLSKTKLAP